jgi:predicted DNA-binding transcriptional regulator AlpA
MKTARPADAWGNWWPMVKRGKERKVLAMDEAKAGGARRMLNLEQVLELVPVGRNTLMRMIDRGDFPHGNYISPNKRVWYEDEVQRWQDSLPAESGRKKRNG